MRVGACNGNKMQIYAVDFSHFIVAESKVLVWMCFV